MYKARISKFCSFNVRVTINKSAPSPAHSCGEEFVYLSTIILILIANPRFLDLRSKQYQVPPALFSLRGCNEGRCSPCMYGCSLFSGGDSEMMNVRVT